jgi:hypothetical protein
MRRPVVPLLAALLVLGMIGCHRDERGPREAFVQLFAAVRDQNDAAILDLVHSESPAWERARFQERAGRADLWTKLAGQIRDSGTTAEVTGVRFKGRRAIVTVLFRPALPGYAPRGAAFLFQRDSGRWRFWMDDRPFRLAARKVGDEAKPAPAANAPAGGAAKKGGTLSKVRLESENRAAVKDSAEEEK